MVSSPVQNINYFVRRRPPLVIFLLCLVGLAVSTFYFAFEIESEARTLDSDKKHDWLQLLKHFNKLKSCVLPISEVENKLKNKPEKENFSVFTQLDVQNTDFLRNFTDIRGFLTLEEWYPTACRNEQILPNNVEIYFKVPNGITKENKTVNVCAEIRGPAEFLPKFSDLNCVVESKPNENKAQAFLTTYLPKDFDPGFCIKGDISKITFSLNQNEIDNYIDDEIRIRIYTNLIWCSYTLVFFIFCIILYAIFYKDDEMKNEIGLRLL